MSMRMLIGLGLSALSASAMAQFCPPGTMYQKGVGWETCVPLPGYNTDLPAEPQEVWADRWGSIAVAAGVFGTSSGMKSKRQARKAALADCEAKGGVQCDASFTYLNQCAAVAWGSVSVTLANRIDTATAKADALKGCAAVPGNENCQIFHAECSLPERIR